MSAICSAMVGIWSGSGAGGIGSSWSSPLAAAWKEAIIDSSTWPCCIAWTRRVENDPPSRTCSTAKRIGRVSSPGRTKYACRECR